MQITKTAKDLLKKLEILKDDLNQELQDMVDTRIETFDDRSEKWQESERGDDFTDMTDELETNMDDIESALSEAIDSIEEILNL